MKKLNYYFEESALLYQKIATDQKFLEKLSAIIVIIMVCVKKKNKLLIAGNGGSAADAQHFSGEFLGHFKKNRKPLPAIALSTDTSTITAIGNDYDFATIFSRQVEALGQKGDVFVVFSTSGNTLNLISAVKKAKKIGLTTISFLGKDGGKLKRISDLSLVIPSNNVPRIQEIHTSLLHIISEEVEKTFYK